MEGFEAWLKAGESSPSKPSVSSFANNMEGFEAWLKAGADPLQPPQPKPPLDLRNLAHRSAPSSDMPRPLRSWAPPPLVPSQTQVGSSAAPPALVLSSLVGSSAHARALVQSSTLPPRDLAQSWAPPRVGSSAHARALVQSSPPPWALAQSWAPPQTQVGSPRSSAPAGSSAHARPLVQSLPPPWALAQSWAPRETQVGSSQTPDVSWAPPPPPVQSSPSPKTTRSSAPPQTQGGSRAPPRAPSAQPRPWTQARALPEASQRPCVLDWPPSMKGFNKWIEAEEKSRAASNQDKRSARDLLEDAYNAFMAAQSRKQLKFVRSAIEPEEAIIKQESASVALFDAIEYADAAVIRRNKAIVELLRLRKAARRRFLAVKLGLPICLYRLVESDIIQCISWNNAESFVINDKNILNEFIEDCYFGSIRSLRELENSLLVYGFTAADNIYTHRFGNFVRGHPELLKEI
ncbi:hypothetical protein ACE6H2_005080 [Prunus campanulata]